MQGYSTKKLKVKVGAFKARLKALSDHNQYSDPEGKAKQAGICSASWSLFGQLWQASRVLAKAVKHVDIENRRILELGCGLALPSLVLQHRGANITASDYHPLSKRFLIHNATINKLEPIPYINLPWADEKLDIGRFDLIVGSDILYEPDHADMLAGLIERIASDKAKVIISCPGRGYRNRFTRSLADLGFTLNEQRVPFDKDEKPPYKGRLLTYRRGYTELHA
ncbi:SAM-dependent methyltransferase [Aliidiomarina taiwanensis]|uniref:SAM-dependent methyltransferase n=1 Tax=Aliidiomarina taiwanensis TaxID=946228 RepID=A0A432X8Y4_9GAMM|nr:SAM-dependent methyltransferase [Aliidiomarina taiwanensis]RUO43711.1 SAM-dependent methyltransferase [Aliidiomarina taiwanensis]